MTPFLLTPHRSLVEIGTNYAVAESERDMGSAVLNFDMDATGRIAVYLFLRDLQRNFDGKIWGQNGPEVVHRVLQFICRTKHVRMSSLTVCFIYIYIYI
jgi:lactosylceramide 4-alpha-galactosyltransferase